MITFVVLAGAQFYKDPAVKPFLDPKFTMIMELISVGTVRQGGGETTSTSITLNNTAAVLEIIKSPPSLVFVHNDDVVREFTLSNVTGDDGRFTLTAVA